MQQIGRYPVSRIIGSGGFGTVHLGADPATGEPVAIKVLDWPEQGWRRQMFRDEAAALRSVNHPNVVRIRDVIDTPDLAALVTDYVEGASLRRVLEEAGPLDGPQALSVLTGALQGLAAVHAAGLVHADLKPENVLLDTTGTSRLIDFGLTGPPRALTGPDTWIGTPAYLAPEVVLGQHIDQRSDLYATAVMLFELLCGRPPYVGPNPVMTALLHVQSPIPDLQRLYPGISDALAGLCTQDLAKNPAERHQNSRAFLTSLNIAATQSYGAEWAAAGATLGTLVASTLAALSGLAAAPAALGLLGAAPAAAPLAAGHAAAGAIGSGGIAAGVGGVGGVGFGSGLGAGGAGVSAAGAGAGAGVGAAGAGAVGAGGAAAAGAGGAGVAGSGGGMLAAIGGAKGAIAAASIFAVVSAGAGAAVLLNQDDDPAASNPPAETPRDVYAYTLTGADPDGDGISETTLVVMDGTDEITRLPDAGNPSWSTDGRYVAAVSTGRLTVVDTDNGATTTADCSDPEGCAQAAVWDGRVVTLDGSRLASHALPALDDRQEVAAAPGGITWNDLLAAGDSLLAFGYDDSTDGYRGGPVAMAHRIDAEGTVTRFDNQLPSGVSLWEGQAFSAQSAYGGPRAAVLQGGSGGACVYGYSLFVVDPAHPDQSVATDMSAMVEGDAADQEYQTIDDLWFDRDGTLRLSSSTNVCEFEDDFTSTSRPGIAQSVWRLEGTTWVLDDDRPLLSTNLLPTGARIDLTTTSTADPADIGGALALTTDEGTEQIDENVLRVFAPAT
ncbi:serine/threonine-protein kinase [Nocardioides sp. WS12]|uniref:serine/threonine-protein kinase n=1 Tax=Nocardioides sp. WS12 TaxID=2486272 RepID=UPI0015F943C4|nr:serine/threonine-protein kinase [Nocardioides sp. WS12]